MKTAFAPYLKDVLPGIFSAATLNPEMGISGQEGLASLTDVLSEVNPSAKGVEGEESVNKMNVVTEEIDEKDVAIQMLAVFIEELGVGYIEWVEQTATVLLALTDFDANDSIRASSAGCLPGLVKCVKEARGVTGDLQTMGKAFIQNLEKAMKSETETDTLIQQVQSFRDIIDELGPGFMNQEEVSAVADKALRIV